MGRVDGQLGRVTIATLRPVFATLPILTWHWVQAKWTNTAIYPGHTQASTNTHPGPEFKLVTKSLFTIKTSSTESLLHHHSWADTDLAADKVRPTHTQRLALAPSQ